jgi:hypothetical protein
MKAKRFYHFKNYKERNTICKACSKSPLKNKRETKRTEKELGEIGLEFGLQGSGA